MLVLQNTVFCITKYHFSHFKNYKFPSFTKYSSAYSAKCFAHSVKYSFSCFTNYSFSHSENSFSHFAKYSFSCFAKYSFLIAQNAVNPNQYWGGGGGHYGPYSFSSISPERLELRASNFLTFSFYLLAVRKHINMLFLDFTCYHGNHFVESTLTKIIKITKLCNFFLICISSK